MERHTPKISKRHALTAAVALSALVLAGCASTGDNTVKVMPGVQKLMPVPVKVNVKLLRIRRNR